MNIVISAHTILRAQERGASYDEIVSTIDNGINIAAKNDRLAKSKVFNFDSYRNGKYYQHKKLEVYYTIEDGNIITVTVYVFYGVFL